jgi:hypothetical protein
MGDQEQLSERFLDFIALRKVILLVTFASRAARRKSRRARFPKPRISGRFALDTLILFARLHAALKTAALRKSPSCDIGGACLPLTMTNSTFSSAIGTTGDGFEEYAPEEDADEMAFVFGATFVIVDKIGAIGNKCGGFGQPFFDFGARASEQCLGLERSARKRTDTANGDAS